MPGNETKQIMGWARAVWFRSFQACHSCTHVCKFIWSQMCVWKPSLHQLTRPILVTYTHISQILHDFECFFCHVFTLGKFLPFRKSVLYQLLWLKHKGDLVLRPGRWTAHNGHFSISGIPFTSQRRIFIFVEGVAPQGRGSKCNRSWRMFVI